jgi:nucleoside-diphosphate-sugar epimerase
MNDSVILITGCSGYIGRRLALRLLEKGKSVRGLLQSAEIDSVCYLTRMGLEPVVGDLLNPETIDGICEGVKVVYNLAGGHFSSVRKTEDLYVKGAAALLDEAAHRSIDAFIVASNGSLYGDCGDRVLDECTEPRPVHPFGAVTMKMEQLVSGYHLRVNVPCIILRIAEVYGPDEYDLIRKMTLEPVSLLGNGANFNSRVHVDDVVNILESAPCGLSPGESYNLSDDEPVRQIDFYRYCSAIAGIPMPKWIGMSDIHERILLSIHGLRALSLRMSAEKLKRALSYEFKYKTYREGISSLLASNTK